MPPDAADNVWTTFGDQRTVLMVCRTLTSTIRLLETQELFRGESRLRFVFTVYDNGTRFNAGSERLLRQSGVDRIIPWAAATGLRPDLVLTASENIDATAVTGPVLVLPHGVGFNKHVPTANGTGRRLAGLPDVRSLRTGRVKVVLAHREQDAQLRAVCPDIAGHTVVTGDATLDRLTASFPLRERYRRLLHTDDHTLVFLSSTWGGEGGIARHRTLPHRLLADLPLDTHRLGMALHPNIWSEYGPRAITHHFADSLDAGLILLPPESGWQAALIAADVVITDHGSIGLYAAALGKRLLLTGDADEIVPGTPLADLIGTAPRLADNPAGQLASAPTDLSAITDRVFDHKGQSVSRLRDELYRAMSLTPPPGEAPLPRIPDPAVIRRQPASYRVSGESRYPASVRPGGDDCHLVVTEAETNLRLFEKASVLCREHRTDHARAWAWTSAMLAAYPGSRVAVAAVAGGAAAEFRDGTRRLLTGTDVPAIASTAYLSIKDQ